MMNSVLVLNQDYSPMTVCSVQRAFMLLFLNKAELLSSIKGKKLRSINTSFPFPSVIKINKYISIPYKGVAMTRHNIFKRDESKCQYCGSTKSLTIDHVIPRSKGGKSIWTNLVTACHSCNSKKGDSNLEKMGMNLLKKPIKPSYSTFLKTSHKAFISDWSRFLNSRKVSA